MEPGVILFRALSLRAEAAVRISSSGCVVWDPLPPRKVSGRPGRPGLLPGAEVQASSAGIPRRRSRPIGNAGYWPRGQRAKAHLRSRRCTRAAPLFSGERSPTVRFGRAARVPLAQGRSGYPWPGGLPLHGDRVHARLPIATPGSPIRFRRRVARFTDTVLARCVLHPDQFGRRFCRPQWRGTY